MSESTALHEHQWVINKLTGKTGTILRLHDDTKCCDVEEDVTKTEATWSFDDVEDLFDSNVSPCPISDEEPRPQRLNNSNSWFPDPEKQDAMWQCDHCFSSKWHRPCRKRCDACGRPRPVLIDGVAKQKRPLQENGMGEAPADREPDWSHDAFSTSQAKTQLAAHVSPMQPWELDKLEATATQVANALSTGRYNHDFGELLLQNLQGWRGAEAWAQAEEARVAAMVAVDDAQSRDELRRWIEQSLVETLREVRKEVHRGRLVGTTSRGSAGASSSTAVAADEFALHGTEEDRMLQEASCSIAARCEGGGLCATADALR